jgi:hypothetical protein
VSLGVSSLSNRPTDRRAGRVAHLVALLWVSLAVGCVATVEERPARVVYVESPPPAPLAEARIAPAAPGMAWVEGYWHWNGVKYVWIPGHWESPPTGYYWIPPHYAYLDGRYLYHPGHWSRRPPRYQAPVPP